MGKTKQVCFYCLHKLWLAVAVCLVVLATIVSTLRIALPYADSYKHQIESLLSAQLGADVHIKQISAGWQKTGPAILLQHVVVRSEQAVTFEVKQASLRLDFWKSLLSRQFAAEHVELTGLRYWINIDTVFQPREPASAGSTIALDAVEQLFFNRLKDFSLNESEIVLFSANHPEITLNLGKLYWRNAGLRHQGYGEVAIAGVTANNLSFIIDLEGARWQDVTGQIYLESAALDVLPLFRQVVPQSNLLEKASINFQVWGEIQQGQIKQVQLELQDNSLYWQRDNQQHKLKLGPGQLLWLPEQHGWSLRSGKLQLASQTEDWQGFQLHLAMRQERLNAHLQQFQLDALEPLVQLLSTDSKVVQAVLSHQPSGYLETLQLSVDNNDVKVMGQLRELSSEPVHDVPGVTGLTGQFWATNDIALVRLHGKQQALKWDDLFLADWSYETIAVETIIQKQQGLWQLSLPNVTLKSTDFHLTAQAEVQFGERPELALVAQLTGLDASLASYYYPQRYMPEKTRAYLNHAIQEGTLQQATLVWQGAFADFPFAEAEGHFEVYADLADVTFKFDEHWPALTELTASLAFINAEMQIAGYSGQLGPLPITDTITATIPNLFAAEQLTIKVNSVVESESLTELMLMSPLEDSLGNTLTYLGLEGQVRADLHLEIGLKTPSVNANGMAELLGNIVNIRAPALAFDQVTGLIAFRNAALDAHSLELSWQGLPIKAGFSAGFENDEYQVKLNLASQAAASKVLDIMGLPDVQVPAPSLRDPSADSKATLAEPVPLAQGDLAWQMQLLLALPKVGFSYQAELRATLDKLALNMPAPFYKAPNEAVTVTAVAHGNAEQSFITAAYPDTLQFQAQLQHSTGKINRAQLSIGPDNTAAQDLALIGTGLIIDINLPKLDVMPWFRLLHPVLQQQRGGDTIFPELTQVRGQIAQMVLSESFHLTNTIFELSPSEAAWRLKLHGTEIASRWQFFHDWHGQGIDVELDYLNLPSAATAGTTEVSDEAVATSSEQPLPPLEPQNWLSEMIPLVIRCNMCAIGHYRLGQVYMRTASDGEKWYLQQFVSDYKGNKFTINGDWQPDTTAGRSRFDGTFSSPNIGALLTEYQLSSAISGSRSDIGFQLNWAGAPHQFRLADLNGKVQFSLGEGALTEVSDQGSRIFSLFSLDSLVRKLRLDFRDVFSKGFFYNKMQGSLTLHHGVAHTNDFAIDGVPGNLSMQGYADLVKRQLDYQMSFAPKVTSSLPVIIAWMVNPATGLAALALDEVFQSAEVISRINFTVTGDFDKPVVTEVNRHSTEVPVPVRIAQPEALPNDENQPRLH